MSRKNQKMIQMLMKDQCWTYGFTYLTSSCQEKQKQMSLLQQ